MAEFILVFDRNGRIEHRHHEVGAIPFQVADLTARLTQAGFAEIETDWSASADWNTTSARIQ